MDFLYFVLLLLLLPIEHSSSVQSIQLKLEGNVYPAGHYYTSISIGNPARPYFLDIDTGSNLTWLECHHPDHGCERCTKKRIHEYLYKPDHSILTKVQCGGKICGEVLEDLHGNNNVCKNKDPHQCHYKVKYVDGMTEGVVANDTITLGGKHYFFIFGCGYNQQPVANFSPVDGILGLGMGTMGFMAQLKKHRIITKDLIAHCLSMHGGGHLYLGNLTPLPAGVTWVPMIKHGSYYSPGRGKVIFNGHPMGANPILAVFDSGATYTYMPVGTYKELVSKVKATLSKSLKEFNDGSLPECWKGSKPFKSIQEAKVFFKPLALQFAHNDNQHYFHIPPENYLIVTQHGNVCLGILDGSRHGQGDKIIIGDISMQDLLVIYDNEAGKIGWIRACPRAKNSGSNI